MIFKFVTFILISTVVIISCSKNERIKANTTKNADISVIQSHQQKKQNHVDEFFTNPFSDEKTKLPSMYISTLDELNDTIGGIKSTKITDIANKYDPTLIDKECFINGSLLNVYYYYVSSKNIYMLQYFSIENNERLLKNNIKIGSNEVDIMLAFGEYDGKNIYDNNDEIYYLGSEYGQISFIMVNGLVEKVILWFAV